jgi:hypothetical protein
MCHSMNRKFHPLSILSGAAGKPYANGGKGDSPDTPDYAKAAQAQGQANLAAAQATAKLNNPNIINPMGTQTVTYGGTPTFDAQGYDAAMKKYQADLAAYSPTTGGTGPLGGALAGAWGLGTRPGTNNSVAPQAPDKNSFWMGSGDPNVGTVNQKLSPGEQAVYDKNLQARQNLGDLSITGSDALKGIIGQNIDFSGAPVVGDGAQTREKVYQALMGRVNEDTANSRDQANSDLIARGIRPGTKAYDDAQNLITRGFNDARSNSEVQAGNAAQQQFGMDTQARNSYIAELLSKRQTPLNEINALMSGSQVNNPFAGGLGYQAGANAGAAPIMQGAQNQGQAGLNSFNSQQAGSNSTMSGLFSLGAAAIPLMFSDVRLKSNIVKIGQHPKGFGIYEYDIFGHREMGVMAQEVELYSPEAVSEHSSGFKQVDYGMILNG